MEIFPALLTLDTITAADGGDAGSFPIRLWDYSTEGSDGATGGAGETVVITHGRRGLFPDREASLDESYPRLAQLAEQAAAQGKRVLFLDWGEAAVGNLPPFGAANRISAVAAWATGQLEVQLAGQLEAQGLTSLTLIGHSLGSYVVAEIAKGLTVPELAPVNLVALDPAFPAQEYDIDGLTDGQQAVAAFSQSASLAFVAEDDIFQTGLAGDNQQAGTVQTSFVVDLEGLRGIFDADNAHGAVIEVYQDFERYLHPTDAATRWVLSQFPRDRIGDGGRQDDDGRHEGVARAAQVDDIWKISRVEGEGASLQFVAQASDLAELEPEDGPEGALNIVASLVSLHLPAGFEHLVLGGQEHLAGRGRGTGNRLYGNRGNNALAGRGGDDQIYGSDGDDALVGNSGDDVLIGQTGKDRLWGDVGDDLLVGGAQADYLSGGRGQNRLRGGAGRDLFELAPTAGFDIIADFEDGLDRLLLSEGLSLDALSFTAQTAGMLIRASGEAIALLRDISPEQLNAADFVVPADFA